MILDPQDVLRLGEASPFSTRRPKRTLAEAERDQAMQDGWRWQVQARRWQRRYESECRIVRAQAAALAVAVPLAAWGWWR